MTKEILIKITDLKAFETLRDMFKKQEHEITMLTRHNTILIVMFFISLYFNLKDLPWFTN